MYDVASPASVPTVSDTFTTTSAFPDTISVPIVLSSFVSAVVLSCAATSAPTVDGSVGLYVAPVLSTVTVTVAPPLWLL